MDQVILLAHVGDLYLSDRDKAAKIVELEARIAELEADKPSEAVTKLGG
jgi:hypothetical protein